MPLEAEQVSPQSSVRVRGLVTALLDSTYTTHLKFTTEIYGQLYTYSLHLIMSHHSNQSLWMSEKGVDAER